MAGARFNKTWRLLSSFLSRLNMNDKNNKKNIQDNYADGCVKDGHVRFLRLGQHWWHLGPGPGLEFTITWSITGITTATIEREQQLENNELFVVIFIQQAGPTGFCSQASLDYWRLAKKKIIIIQTKRNNKKIKISPGFSEVFFPLKEKMELSCLGLPHYAWRMICTVIKGSSLFPLSSMSLWEGKTTNTSAAIWRDGLIIFFSPILIEKTIFTIVYLTTFRDPQIRSVK